MRRPWLYLVAIPVTLWRRIRRWLYAVREYNVLQYALPAVADGPVSQQDPRIEILTAPTNALVQLYRQRYAQWFNDVDAALHRVSQRFLNGDRCFVLSEDDHITTQVWASTRTLMEPELERYRPLQAGEVALYDIYTLPSFRSQGYYAAVFRSCVAYYQREARRAAVMVVDGENVASLNANYRVGIREIPFRLWRVRCLGHSWIMADATITELGRLLQCPWDPLRLSWDIVRGWCPTWRRETS